MNTPIQQRDVFTDTALARDPLPWVEAMQARGPVTQESFHNSVVVTGYDEVSDIFTRPEDFSSAACIGGPLSGLPFTPEGDDITAAIAANHSRFFLADLFITLDGKEHQAYRNILTRLLTFKRLKANEIFINEFAGELIDGFAGRGRCDMHNDFSQPLTAMVITDLLGIPPEDREALRAKILPAPGAADVDDQASFADPTAVFVDIFTDVLKDRRANPRDDLLTELANSKMPDGMDPGLPALVRLAAFLFIGGQDTSAKLLTSCIRVIAERQDMQKALREDRELIPNFVEEVLRIESPTKLDFRLTSRTTKIANVEVKAGTIVTMSLTGANRDPGKFERPNEIDLHRTHSRDHLAFGRGPHGCLGAPLARMEARVGIERLLDRFAEISLDPEFHGPEGNRRFNYMPSYLLRGLEELHVKVR